MHWGDADSADLLLDVLEAPDAPSMLVVGTAQEVHLTRSPMLHPLQGEDAARIVAPLAPDPSLRSRFAHEDASRLALRAARRGGDARGGRGHCARIRRQSLLRARARPAGPGLSRGRGAFVGDALHVSTRLLRRRIEALRPELRAVLEIVATAGQPVPHGSLAAPARVADEARLLIELREAHLVRNLGATTDRSVECYHDRIREATIAAMSPERVAECHKRLAAALERRGDVDPEVLLDHYRRAGDLEIRAPLRRVVPRRRRPAAPSPSRGRPVCTRLPSISRRRTNGDATICSKGWERRSR